MESKRAGNMTAGDRAMTVELAEKYWHKVENKKVTLPLCVRRPRHGCKWLLNSMLAAQ